MRDLDHRPRPTGRGFFSPVRFSFFPVIRKFIFPVPNKPLSREESMKTMKPFVALAFLAGLGWQLGIAAEKPAAANPANQPPGAPRANTTIPKPRPPPAAPRKHEEAAPAAAATRLNQDLRKLWSEHTIWTSHYVVAAVSD